MKRHLLIVIGILLTTMSAFAGVDIIERTTISQDDTTTLYQVGTDGEYCVSLTPDESGCVSGIDDAKNTVNLLDIVKGKYVVFENLSDSPHDMKFTGQNAEELPPQGPGAAPVEKKMLVTDLSNQKVNCSFHGDMLAVGYRVPDDGEEEEVIFSKDEHAAKRVSLGRPQAGPSRPITNTKVADVSKEVLKTGNPALVEKLVAKKPGLINQLAGIRPLLAKELKAKGLGANQLIDNGDQEQGGENGQSGPMWDTGKNGANTLVAGAGKNGKKGKNAKGGKSGKNGKSLKNFAKSKASSFRVNIAAGKVGKNGKDAKKLAAARALKGLRGIGGGTMRFRSGMAKGGKDGKNARGLASRDGAKGTEDKVLTAAFRSLAGGKFAGSRSQAFRSAGLNGQGASGNPQMRNSEYGIVDLDNEKGEPQSAVLRRLFMGLLGLSILVFAVLLRRKKKEDEKEEAARAK